MISRRVSFLVAAAALLSVAAVAPTADAGASRDLAPPHIVFAPVKAAANARPTGGSGISYHGGPIMLGTTHAYAIWYGNWTGSTGQTIITDFLNNIGGSPYYGINTTYYNGSKTPVSNSVTLAGSTTDAYSQGATNLSDAQIQTIVSTAITGGKLPADPNGVYFVLTSADVSKSGFLTQYCGWHTYGSIAGSTIKYSFVGDPSANMAACSAQTTSPNGNAPADAMISVIAHELEEAVTDPQLNAWYDKRGYENADKCAWKFGATYTTSNGSLANMKLGARDYLVQQNWVNAGTGSCALHL